MLVRLTPERCDGLRTAFERVGYDVDGVPELLGEAAHATLGRAEPVPARLLACWLYVRGKDWPDRVSSWLPEGGGVVLEQSATAGDGGWATTLRTARRVDGPGWRHEVDEPAAALLAGCRGALQLDELFALLAFSQDRPVGELISSAPPSVRELARHGLLVPAERTA